MASTGDRRIGSIENQLSAVELDVRVEGVNAHAGCLHRSPMAQLLHAVISAIFDWPQLEVELGLRRGCQ